VHNLSRQLWFAPQLPQFVFGNSANIHLVHGGVRGADIPDQQMEEWQ
jgi:hypothetical protein